MNTRSKLLFLLLLGSCLSVTFPVPQGLWHANADTAVGPLPSMSLTVIGNGTTIVLNETGIGEMQAYSGYGGFKNSLGILKGLGNYTGVPLTTLCSLVETLANTSVVKILAADNYNQTLTYSQICGNFTTYDNTTGQQTPHNQPLTPILAYHLNGQNLTSGDGPLRLAIVGPEGLATDSTYWVKQVIQIEVVDQPASDQSEPNPPVPEFFQPALLPLLFITTLAAVLYARVYPQRRGCAGNVKKNRLFKVMCG
jgi:hypothetical protein